MTADTEPDPTAPRSEIDFLGGDDSHVFRHVIVWISALNAAYLGLRWFSGGDLSRAVAPVVILAGGPLAWWLNRHGSTRASFVLYFWLLWVALAVQASLRAGVANPALHGFSVLILLGGWALGLRQGVLLGIASMAATAAMAWLQTTGRWAPLPFDDTFGMWLTAVLTWACGLAMLILVLPRHWQQFDRVRDLNRALEASVLQLEARTQALERAEQRYAAVRAAAPLPIAITRISDGQCIEVNPAWVQLFGWSREEAVGRTALELGMWQRKAHRDVWIEAFRREGRSVGIVAEMNTRGGRVVTVRLFAEPVEYDNEQYVLVQFLDETERVAAQARVQQLNGELAARVAELETQRDALERSERRLQRMAAAIPLPLTISTLADGRYVDVNAAWVRDFGWAREEAIGHTSLEIGFWPDKQTRDRALASLRRGESMQGDEVDVRRRDGSTARLRIFAELAESGGERVLVAAFLDDSERLAAQARIEQLNAELELRVGERTQELGARNAELATALDDLRRTQEELLQSEKLSSMGRLVAGVAHELNTPIGNALTAATTIRDTAGEFAAALEGGNLKRSQLSGFVAHVNDGADLTVRSLTRAADLVASFKKVAIDQASERRREFDLAETVGEVLDTLRPSLKGQPWHIVVEVPPDIVMEGYPGPLDQVLINLIMNATLHAFEGRKAGTITVRAQVVDAETVALSCIDDGVGIPTQNIDRIFDPFYTTRLGRGGSGLGLTIVHRIVTRLLGGQVAVTSSPGGGTTFTVRMPRVAPRVVV